MLAHAEVEPEKPNNVISMTRHASFKKASSIVRVEDPVESDCPELFRPLTVIRQSAWLPAKMPPGEPGKDLTPESTLSSKSAPHHCRDPQRATRLRRIMVNAREFRPAEMTQRLIDDAGDYACLYGVAFDTVVRVEVPDVLIAPDQRIAQLLATFMKNSVKHAIGKEITISVSGKTGPGSFDTVFRIETTLTDMSNGTIDRITSFQAVHAHIGALFCGRGLGMAQCKGLAARIGARIAISDKVDQRVAIELATTCRLPKTYTEPLLLV